MDNEKPQFAKLRRNSFTGRWEVRCKGKVIVSGKDKETVRTVAEGLGYIVKEK